MKLTLLCAFAFLLVCSINAQNSSSFKHFGTTNFEYVISMTPALDGGFYGVGTSEDGTQADALLIKYNASGEVVWSKTYGKPSSDFGLKVIEQENGNLMLACNTYSFDATGDYTDILLVNISPDGNEIWSKVYGGTDYDDLTDLIQYNNGDFGIVARSSSYSGALIETGLIIRVSSGGDIIWSKTFGSNVIQYFYQATKDANDNVYAIGNSLVPQQSFNAFVVKINSAGDISWAKTLGGTGGDIGYALTTRNDSIWISGVTTSFGLEFPSLYVSCLNANDGALLWANTYSNSLYQKGNAILANKNGNELVVAGKVSLPLAGDTLDRALVLFVNSNGAITGNKAHIYDKNTNNSEAWGITEIGEDVFIGGELFNADDPSGGCLFIRTSWDGNASCGDSTVTLEVIAQNFLSQNVTQTESQEVTFSDENLTVADLVLDNTTYCEVLSIDLIKEDNTLIYPNPFSDKVVVEIKNAIEKPTLSIFNLQGALVKSIALTDSSTIVNLSELSNGCYVFQILGEHTNAIKKVFHQY